MKTILKTLCFLCVLCGNNFAGENVKPFILGTDFFEIPKNPKPERGVTFDDPVFGGKVTRITDPSDGWGNLMRRHAYATFDPSNCTGTWLLVEDGAWHVYDIKTAKHVKELKGQSDNGPIGDIGSPRWDPKDPNICYYVETKGTRFLKYNVQTDEVTVIHDFKKDFPEMKWLAYHGYDEPSIDARYWGFGIMDCKFWEERGKALAVVVYDRKEDKIVGQHAADHGAVVGVSPSGKRILYANTSFRNDFTDPVPMAPDMGHGDFAIDCNGREVFVFQDNKTDYWTSEDLLTGKKTCLVSQIHGCKDWEEYKKCGGTGVHFSGNCYATPGWAVVSTYGHKKEKDIWCTHVLYLLKLEEGDPAKPTVWRVAHAHSVYDPANEKHYWAETHGTIDRYGRRIFFASNWDDVKAPIETYRCDLPAGWYEKLMGEEKAKEVREKAAATLGISVQELTNYKAPDVPTGLK